MSWRRGLVHGPVPAAGDGGSEASVSSGTSSTVKRYFMLAYRIQGRRGGLTLPQDDDDGWYWTSDPRYTFDSIVSLLVQS